MTLERGDRVTHSKWGGGQVIKLLAHKAARVAFDRAPSLPRTIKLCELRSALPANEFSASTSSPITVAPPSWLAGQQEHENHRSPEPAQVPAVMGVRMTAASIVRPNDSVACAWQTLEALRLGVVPTHGVQEYTVSRDAELASISSLLEDRFGCRVLWGDYGSGKTHLLETAEHLALERGFATARITLDPRENALCQPLRLYRCIARSVRVEDHLGLGLDWLFERLKDSPQHFWSNGSRSSRFFSPYLMALREGCSEDISVLRDYVLGEEGVADDARHAAQRLGWQGNRLLAMSDFRTFGRMYIHLVGTLASWFSDAGASGLVVLFDEVERVDALGQEDQHYALEVLKHYAAVTMKRTDLSFDPDRLYKGGHRVHRKFSLRFDPQQPLLSIFALTPLEEIRKQFASITASSSYDVNLGPLDENLIPELVNRIAMLYERAYPGHEVSQAVRDRTAESLLDVFEEGFDSFRSSVRGAVQLLDGDRLPAFRNGQ